MLPKAVAPLALVMLLAQSSAATIGAEEAKQIRAGAAVVDITPREYYPISMLGSFGDRNAPTAAYAALTPDFRYDSSATNTYTGGQFLDGRAANLADQAKGPFLNPLEMANPDKAAVVDKVRSSNYASLFEQIYGAGSLNNVDSAYDQIADAI